MGAAPPPDAVPVDQGGEIEVYLGTVRTRSGDLVFTVDGTGDEPITVATLIPHGYRALDPVELTVSEAEDTAALILKAVELSKTGCSREV